MSDLQRLLDKWRSTGRLAFHYPRLRTVSLNGGKAKPEKEVIKYLKEFFKE